MLVLNIESYQDRYAQNYGNFTFDTDFGTGVPYYLDEMKKSLKNMESHISLISNDIKEIIYTYGISDKYPQELNDTIDKINYSYDLLKGSMDYILKTMEDTMQGLLADNKLSLEEIETINEKFGLNTDAEVDQIIQNRMIEGEIVNQIKDTANNIVEQLGLNPDEATKQRIGNLMSEIDSSLYDIYNTSLATELTWNLSTIEGFGQYCEEVKNGCVLAHAMLASPFLSYLDKSIKNPIEETNCQYESMVDSLWKKTIDYVNREDNKWMYDSFYNNTQIGNYLRDNTYEFDTIREKGTEAGEVLPAFVTGMIDSRTMAADYARHYYDDADSIERRFLFGGGKVEEDTPSRSSNTHYLEYEQAVSNTNNPIESGKDYISSNPILNGERVDNVTSQYSRIPK